MSSSTHKLISNLYQERVTPYYANLIAQDPAGAMALQGYASDREKDPVLPSWIQSLSESIYGRPAPWHADAIGDLARLAAPRLTHRYGNRAILHTTANCAVYCRFCFRKAHLNEKDDALYGGDFSLAMDYIKKTPAITEVILTGGDPLSLNDRALAALMDALDSIAHVKVVRFHSRMAVTLPSRFTTSLLDSIGARHRRVRVYLVSHFNHPLELTAESLGALDAAARSGLILLNQSVLLRGVNDATETLRSLFQNLYNNGVISFYLHHPDWTPGTFHFRRSIADGQKIYQSLRGILSGPALPQYVLDIPQGYGKIPVTDGHLRLLENIQQDNFHAAMYQITPPQLRGHQSPATIHPLKYLDINYSYDH